MTVTLAREIQAKPASEAAWRNPASVLLSVDELDTLIDSQVAVFWNGPNLPPGPIAGNASLSGPNVPPGGGGEPRSN